MRLRQATVGGLNLFGVQPNPLDEEARVIAKALADIATIGILQQRSLHRSTLLAENLQRALNTRVVIEQAKGVPGRARGHADGRDVRSAAVLRRGPTTSS